MDSYRSFVEIFKQAASARNFDVLLNIFQDGRRFLAIVSLEDRESIVCSIFDKEDGLLHFLDDELHGRISSTDRSTNRCIDNILKEAFHFLEFFIKNFYTTSCFVQHIRDIKKRCQSALIMKCDYYTQKAACDAFTKLIELFKDHDLQIVETIVKFSSKFDINTIRERRLMFCVISKIIKHNETICLPPRLSMKCFERLNSDASEEYKPKVPRDFDMYFDILADMLDNIEPPDQIKGTLLNNFYEWIKELSQLDRQQKNIQQRNGKVIKSAIDFLSHHMNRFRDLLYPDYKFWHDILRSLSLETTNCGTSGQYALKRFYRFIGQILTNQNNKENNILVEFLEYFQREFQNTNLNLTTLKLIVYGFSQMAEPCKVHMETCNLNHMFSIITSYALPLCSSEHSYSTHIENVCCYQEALSEILCHMTDVTIEKIKVLVKLSTYIIKRFPDLSNNTLAISTLIKTVCNLASINKNLLQQYLDSIVYDGVAWSCSHTLALDAELQQELNDLKQSPVCYKNYVPLWTELLNTERYPGEHEQLAQHVADTMMDMCIALINRLNIQVKRKNEDTVLSDIALTQSAVNQADFRVFMNLVDLYIDMIDASELQLFANTVHRFLYEIIRLSYRYPLISGFYKLIRIGMKIFVKTSEEEQEEERNAESRQTEELLSNYLWHTLDLIPAFSNELLIACLYLILNAPFVYVEEVLPRTLSTFKIAFAVGLSNLELAYTALTTLETWTMPTTAQKQKRDERTNELLREIIECLEPYLGSTESSVEISQDLTTVRKRVKRVDVIDTECTLRNFQRRVLLFLGSLDHDLFSSFVHKRASCSTGVTWDRKNLLKYTLPLKDARPIIYFDRTLPRIIELARDSSDRRTKIAACEVLHSIVTLFIGSRNFLDSENHYAALCGTLCRAVLALGCDPDEVVCSLFHPYALQLMHWLSSMRLMLMSPVIDSLFDGLTDDSNPALREFSGMCLAEFTRWSIRQTEILTNPHICGIIERINNLALHPSTRKRVAAAVAFNRLYVILREDDETVSMYWLEIFYCFVRSLDGCVDPSIANALAHIEKVIKSKVDLLNLPNETNFRERRKPHEFDDATLTYALYWLLSQCGTLDEYCRAKCMELYVNISQYVGNSAQEITQNFVETYGINRLNDIILKGLESGVEDISMIDNIIPLLKALDCYVWLIDKKLLPVERLLPNNVDQTIFLCIRNFAYQFWQLIAGPSVETSATIMKSRELEQLQALQCKVLMTTLNFIRVLLNSDINLPESLWDESLSALTIRCIMHPRTVGFDMKNVEMTDKLPHVLEDLLNSIRLRYNHALPDILEQYLLNSVRKYITKLLYLYDIAQSNSCNELIQHVNGLILLKRCDMLNQMILETSAFRNGEDTIRQIFKFLVRESMTGESVCRDLNARMIEYLRTLMEFQFSLFSSTIEVPVRIIPDDTRSMTEMLVTLITNKDPVIDMDCTMITHGEYFLNIFKSVIFNCMLTRVSAIIYVYECFPSSCDPSLLLKWTEDLILFLKHHRRELQVDIDAIVNVILEQFTYLNNAVYNMDSRRERLINIYSIAAHLKSKPTEMVQNHEFYQWIQKQLRVNDLEYKTKILESFFVCLMDQDLQIDLKGQSLCSDLSETSVNAMKVINCFETLLGLLSTTKSMIMLKHAIYFADGIGKHLFNEKLEEHLRGYYYGMSLEHVLESLQLTYRMFMDTNTIETNRLDVLRGFLLPAFKFCDTTAIEQFFVKNIRALLASVRDNLHDTDDDDVIKQIIVSKIGCFQLIGIMFARVDENKIHANDQNSQLSDQILIDRKLYRDLYLSTIDIRSMENIRRPGFQEFMRLLHCSAYNCSLAIVRLKNDEHFFSVAFAENWEKNCFIWKNIIDHSTQYKLGQTFKEYPKTREITVNIKSAEVDRDGQRAHRYAYVHSYDLSACTLSEDINAYDLNKCVVLPSDFRRSATTTNATDSDPLRAHGATSIALKSNDFNEHECMPYICVFLRHIRKLFRLNPDKPPRWLELFLATMLRPYDNIQLIQNIQLFILKVISNTADEVFKPYAGKVLTYIIKGVADYLQRSNLNYIITDILEILMDWHDVAVPNDTDGKAAAQRLFEVLAEKVFARISSDHQRVYSYNLGLLRTMMEKWRGCLRMPSEFLNRKMNPSERKEFNPAAVVYLILLFLDNDITEEIVARNDIIDFLFESLSKWKQVESVNIKDETFFQCCECLGLYLRSLDNSRYDEAEKERKKDNVKERIRTILGTVSLSMEHNLKTKQVKLIATLCRTYPEVAKDYIYVTMNAMVKCLTWAYCLEIFALAMSRLNAEEIMSNLRHMEVQRILKNRMPSCEKIALQIVRDMVATVSSTDLLPYVNLTNTYIKDNITEHRELVYDILMKIHKRYSEDIAMDTTVQDLLSISMRNLLAGLLDPSLDLQEKILKFWTEKTSLSKDDSKDRLLALLAMHSSRMTTEEDAFAPFVLLLMLQLTTRSVDYTKKIFDASLQDKCTFQEYKIAVSWRRRNLSCMTPMFVDSLASQISYSTLSQSIEHDGSYSMTPKFSHLHSSHIPPRLRATQDLQFDPTPLEDDDITNATTMLDISSHDAEFDRTTIASTSRGSPQTAMGHKRFNRILANPSDFFRNQQIRNNDQREKRIRQESIRQRSSVKLYRDYRIGDFPDIEIPHASLIVPLQQLIKLDRQICRDVTVSFFCSLIEEIIEREKSDDYRRIVVENLKRILHDSCERDSTFNVVILETLLQLSRDTATIADCNPRDIEKMSKTNHLNVLGTLLLERSLLSNARGDDSSPTSSKRMRRHDDDIRKEEINKWTQLASLYKSLNDVDVVLSIFRREQFFGRDVQEAALAEVDGDWIRAKNAFANAYEQTRDLSIKEHCLQGLLEAASNMCDWSTIDRLVKDRANNRDLSNIWNDEWRDWMIPYACDAYVHLSEKSYRTSHTNDMDVIQSWTYDRDKLQHFMPTTGENLVVCLLEKDVKKAADLLNDLLDMTRNQWIGLNPLCTELRIRKLFNLQIMKDLDTSLKVLRSTDRAKYMDELATLLNFWSMKTPTVRDNLVQWNKLATYRAYSSMLFQDIHLERRVKRELLKINYQLRFGIIDAALNQKHRYIAEEHFNRASRYLNDISEMVCEEDVHQLELSSAWLEARVTCLCGDVETNMFEKMSKYTDSWESLHKLLNKNDELDADMSTAIKERIGTMASKIEFLSRENDVFANALSSNITILRDIGTTGNDLDNIRQHLLRYSLNNLRSCCENATTANIGEHYCALARHCYGRLMSTDAESDDIFQEFLLSTLRSMNHDYLEATHYFPCLLRPEQLRDDKTREIFVQECAKLRPWLFLRWRDLLFSHLGTPSIATAVVSIVERLAEIYPDAIAYTYHLTVEKNPGILQEKIQRIRSLLRDKAEGYERFLRAIQYVVQPKLYLKHYLDEAMKDLSRGKTSVIESLLRKVYPDSNATKGKNPRPGVNFKEIASYESKIKALNSNNRDIAREGLQRLKELLNEFIRKSMNGRDSNKLKDYSPFLYEYIGGSGGGIEVPGQYTGDREPMPRYHVRIARFEPQVEVMRSLRKPIRIGIMGDNGREYKFLVKFGEDLTIDRGLQQLYSTMNRTLRNDPGCRQRRLAIDTYEVIPLSSSFGLIQWIEDTRSLEDLVMFSLSTKEKKRRINICEKYATWIENAARTKRITDRYKVALTKYSQQDVTEYMKDLISETKQTALRDTFDAISPSPESFVTLRRNFVASYATMCVAHWLAGIGDRHLQNTLVNATGRCLGIDFGHAFGNGIRAPIPELVPFRLTSQILELLRPFTERDLLATIMTHTMRALRDDRGPILACMDIFIHKPVQRTSLSDDEIITNNGQDIDADLTWSSKRNIEIVAKKLNGIHPSIIMLEQLKEAHNDEYYGRYYAIITGNDQFKQARADVRTDRLTPVEQVDCLLDQATDLNVLGRMYEKWQSWL